MERANNKILVVDDEENNRDMLSRRLQRAGFIVDSANGGEEALQRVRTEQYDLILLDHMMPGLTGIDVLQSLRATYSAEQLPILMVTAVNESEKIVDAIGMGANDYITKPVDFPVALARVKSQLSRKMAGSALREREERFSLAARGTQEGLWDWDLRSQKVYYSPGWVEMLGYQEGEIGSSFLEWFERVPQPDRGALWSAMEQYWKSPSATPIECEHRIIRKDGSRAWFVTRGLAVRDQNGEAVRMVGSSIEITSQRAYDLVTGLPNRVFLEDWLSRAAERKVNDPSLALTTILVGLQRSHLLQQTFGHAAHDEFLREMANRVQEQVGPEPIVAYVASDEFAVLYESGVQREAMCRAKKLVDALKAPYSINGNELWIDARAGIAISDSPLTTPSEILQHAKTALHSAGMTDHSCCAVFSTAMRDRAANRLELEMDLRKAIERGQLVPYFQSKVCLETGRIVGFEALIRWNHPKRGFISPGEFIPVAEQTGTIIPIGRWMIEQACRQLQSWNRKRSRPLSMSVNVSPLQFGDEGLAEFIDNTLAACDVNPGWLDLEITESSFVNETERATEVLSGLKSLGVGLKLDDFGTGYSALSYLRRLPFDALKIDQSFIRELVSNEKNKELVRTIVSMARELGMEVVAEGVETPEQAAILHLMSCQYGQGYLFSRPISAQAAEQLLAAEAELKAA